MQNGELSAKPLPLSDIINPRQNSAHPALLAGTVKGTCRVCVNNSRKQDVDFQHLSLCFPNMFFSYNLMFLL